ncbi:hypothetical protein QGM71_12265 [Virgibacillus sp. C22-A2]|uniref:Uncharacterized protein n=1 Tax=Virgibacillus tibetensis TaxID=3042313 RepID=A0ABU6KG27_9BACI|nr:hypothetical protein [Virgibacillus sp. C22-A2]
MTKARIRRSPRNNPSWRPMSVDVLDSFSPLFERNEQLLQQIDKRRKSAILNFIFKKLP